MKVIVAISVLIVVLSSAGLGQPKNVAKDYFSDTPLTDQDGKEHRLYTDLMDGRVVIISSYHTDCTGGGMVVLRTLQIVQEALKNRANEFYMLSISVDPTDDAAKSKAFATTLKAGPGWYFLTGEKANMEFVLKKLGMFVEKKEDHSLILLVGNLKTGLWKKVSGMGSPAEVRKAIESVLNDPQPVPVNR